MILFDKLGYKITYLEPVHGIELFRFLHNDKNNDYDEKERYGKREGVKSLIRGELNKKYHTPIGIRDENNILIGVCFTEIERKNTNIIKLTYIKLNKEYIDTDAKNVLFYYLLNILYKDMNIIYDNNKLDKYGDITRRYPSIIGISSFKDGYAKELAEYIERA